MNSDSILLSCGWCQAKLLELRARGIRSIDGRAYDWYNCVLLRMGGMPVGPCKRCHELKSILTIEVFNLLAKLELLNDARRD